MIVYYIFLFFGDSHLLKLMMFMVYVCVLIIL